MRLEPDQWAEVVRGLRALDPSDPDLDRLSQIVFEARVQARFAGPRGGGTLAPTKQTSALPWVGLACGAILLVVGGALGGGAVLAGVVVLGVFVFGIALAGSRVAHRRRDARDGGTPVGPMPPPVGELVSELRPPPPG